jgi:hypothetical protein
VDVDRVHVALITEDRPRRDLREAATAILDAGIVVADDADRGAQFRILDGAFLDQERVGLRAAHFAGADDDAVLGERGQAAKGK